MRLYLTPIHADHVKDVFELRSSPLVRKYIQKPLFTKMEEAEAFVSKCIRDNRLGHICQWSIKLKDSEEVIGTICLWNFSDDRLCAEIGYDLKVRFHKQGFMSEAMECVLYYAERVLHLLQVEAYTHKDNEASIKLLEKHGFEVAQNRFDQDYPDNVIFVLDVF